MEFIKPGQLDLDQQQNFDVAYEASLKSKGQNQAFVGAVLVTRQNNTFLGATVSRSRVIGSTCAERMALDQWFFNSIPYDLVQSVFVIGKMARSSWRDNLVCTPCGVCLEMFFEYSVSHNFLDLNIYCSSWDRSSILRANLSELYPHFGKGDWPFGALR